jgi:hypothetical protein
MILKNFYNIIWSKDNLTPDGVAQIQQFRKNMTEKRIVF